MRTAGRAIATIAAVCACSHANRPCPAYRELDRPLTALLAPSDPATTADVAAAGARYEVCPNRRSYIVVREGKRELTESEALAIRTAFFMGDGQSASLGGCDCAETKPPRLCIVVSLRENAATPADIARRLVTSAIDTRTKDATARVQVSILSVPRPRCAVGDPACGPVPYDAECVEKTSYSAKAARHIVGPGASGQCAHDGDCRVAGCGNECVPGTALPENGIACDEHTELERAYCGCVNTACAWFRTDR